MLAHRVAVTPEPFLCRVGAERVVCSVSSAAAKAPRRRGVINPLPRKPPCGVGLIRRHSSCFQNQQGPPPAPWPLGFPLFPSGRVWTGADVLGCMKFQKVFPDPGRSAGRGSSCWLGTLCFPARGRQVDPRRHSRAAGPRVQPAFSHPSRARRWGRHGWRGEGLPVG